MQDLDKVMTVKELRDHLESFEDDDPVLISYDYGDHCHTEVAEKIRAIETINAKWSDYHKAFVNDFDGDEQYAVILKSVK